MTTLNSVGDEYTSSEDIHGLRRAIAGVCQHYGVPDPARWLATVMTGQDPRPMEAPILEMVRKIVYREFDEEGGDPFPDPIEWQNIVEHVLGSETYQHARVSLAESHKAAHKLMDFLHKNQKQITADVRETETTEPAAITEVFE